MNHVRKALDSRRICKWKERATCKRCTDVDIIIKSYNSRGWQRAKSFVEFKTGNHDSNFKIPHESLGSSESVGERRKWRFDDSTHQTVERLSTKYIHRQIYNWTNQYCWIPSYLVCQMIHWSNRKEETIWNEWGANKWRWFERNADSTGGFPKASFRRSDR